MDEGISVTNYMDQPFEFASKNVNVDDKFIVGSIPTVYYVPEWISEDEESKMIDIIYDSPDSKWVELKRRRLQSWGGTPKSEGMIPEKVPIWCTALCDRLVNSGAMSEKHRPNHVLMNEYRPGQGIMPHQDGPLYSPYVSILSLASSVRIDFFQSLAESRVSNPCISLYLQPRSLLVFRDNLYTQYWHGISETFHDEIDEKIVNFHKTNAESDDVLMRDGVRLSLTVRHALCG
eukprot:116425_1